MSPLVPLMRRYLFVFAFENSIQPDYVTEKFYIPLMAGAVPVYLGAPNIVAFAPDPESYIDVNQFASPEALAAHLLHLQAHPDAYARLHAWRDRPWAPHFRRIAAQAINQGRIYNEGAVHGTAQRISPLRLSSALTDLYRRGAEGQGENAMALAVADAEARRSSGDARHVRAGLPHLRVGIDIGAPSNGEVVTMSLLHGLYVSFRVDIGSDGSVENGHRDGEGRGCGDVLEMVVVVDGTIRCGVQVPACEERLVQVEGLTPGTHSLRLAVAPHGLPTRLAEAASTDDAARDLGTPNTPLAGKLDSWEAAWRHSAGLVARLPRIASCGHGQLHLLLVM